jgi:CRP-like cAMP-binding protein
MHNPLTRKLVCFADLSEEDTDHLDHFCSNPRTLRAGTDLILEGDRPEEVFFIVEGWACRHKMLPDGKRQIMAYLIPGDLCDINIFILKEMDHSISLLSEARVAAIPKEVMRTTLLERPAIGQGLFWATLVDEAVLREWLVNLGQRDAYERLAHLFCEMWLRLQQVGLTSDGEFVLPLTQEQLGETMGLTSVHVNRVLQRMRANGLITLSSKQMHIHDIERLRQIADFDPNYLHLDRRN